MWVLFQDFTIGTYVCPTTYPTQDPLIRKWWRKSILRRGGLTCDVARTFPKSMWPWSSTSLLIWNLWLPVANVSGNDRPLVPNIGNWKVRVRYCYPQELQVSWNKFQGMQGLLSQLPRLRQAWWSGRTPEDRTTNMVRCYINLRLKSTASW